MTKTTFGERIIIVCLLSLFALLAMQTCRQTAEQLSEAKEVIQMQHDTIKRTKDVAGREHAEKYVMQADFNTLRAMHQQEMDSVLTLLNLPGNQVQNVQLAGIQTSGSGRPKVDTVFVDSSHSNYAFSFNDKWMDFKGQIGDSSYIRYQNTDSLIFSTYKDRAGTKINAYSLNPNTRFTGLTSLNIPAEKPKRLAFGPYVGVSYQNGKPVLQAGVGFHYNLIHF